MNSKKQKEEHKKMSVKRTFNSIKYSIEGLVHAYKNEQSLWLHGFGSIFAIIMGFVLQISLNQWAIVITSLAVILAVELLNTAIEAVVDMVTDKFHPLAKVAKDCGSAAAFVSTFVTVIILAFIFVPKIIELLNL